MFQDEGYGLVVCGTEQRDCELRLLSGCRHLWTPMDSKVSPNHSAISSVKMVMQAFHCPF